MKILPEIEIKLKELCVSNEYTLAKLESLLVENERILSEIEAKALVVEKDVECKAKIAKWVDLLCDDKKRVERATTRCH